MGRGTAIALFALLGCAENMHQEYAASSGVAAGGRDAGVRKATAALVDAGFTIASSDAGVVTTEWMDGRSLESGQKRYRFTVTVEDGGGFVVNAGCQDKSAFTAGWNDCDATRPQWVIDAQHGVETAMQTSSSAPAKTEPRSYFCTSSAKDTTVAACALKRDECDAVSTNLIKAADDLTPCAPAKVVVCYRTLAVDGSKAEHCFPTMNACTTAHDEALSHGDAFSRVSPCKSSGG
jgi:hypothetical protein